MSWIDDALARAVHRDVAQRALELVGEVQQKVEATGSTWPEEEHAFAFIAETYMREYCYNAPAIAILDVAIFVLESCGFTDNPDVVRDVGVAPVAALQKVRGAIMEYIES